MKVKALTFKVVLLSVLFLTLSLLCSMAFFNNNHNKVYAMVEETITITGVPCETQTLTAETENMSGTLAYQWQYCDTINGIYSNISGATSITYTLPNDIYNGKYIKVVVSDGNGSYEQTVGAIGNFIEFDLAKGNVVLEGTYSGYSSGYTTGNADVTGTHETNNIYYVTQTNPTQATPNNIAFGGSDLAFNLTINGINSSASAGINSGITINARSAYKKYVTIRLMGENYIKQLFYATGAGSSPTGYVSNDSTLKITSADGDGSTNGSLIINNTVSWSAGIGGIDDTDYEGSTGITIAGGTINVTAQRSAAIGGGGNGYADITITGGIINATNGGTGATIGGGGGMGLSGGQGNITITGGIVNATNDGFRNTSGVAIGGSGSETDVGSIGTVTITGGIITANGGIGGGNSNEKTGGDADVNISGGTIISNSIGGGYSNVYGFKNSNVTITGGSVNASIAGTPTNGTEQVYLTRVAVYAKDVLNPSSSIDISNAQVVETSLNVENATYYGDKNMFSDENAFLYLWLPEETLVVSCDMIVDGAPATFDGAVSAKSIGVLKNDEILFYVVNIASHEGYELYYNNSLFDGSMVVRADSGFAFEMELKSGTTLNQGYRSTINGTVSNLTHISNNNGRYQYQFTANANTYVWFAVTKDGAKRLALDLYAGDIIIEAGTNNNTHKVTYAGYVLDNYNGAFYISSNFYPASNSVNVISGTHDIYIDKLIANHSNSIITVGSNAVLNLSASTENNQMSSSGSSVITVNTNGTLNLTVDKNENLRYASLKLNGGDNCSVIGGNGNVNIIKQMGFLELNIAEGCTKSQVSAQKYSYTTDSLSGAIPYSLTMTGGKLVGYKESGNGLYLPNATHTISTNTAFTACAISYVKSDNVSCVENISSNNLNVNITLTGSISVGSIVVKREGTTLIENTDWSYDRINQTITINGSEAYDNLNVEIITAGEIVYLAHSYNGVYDGNSHSISVTVSSPNVYTLEYSLDNVNFSENEISSSNVCNITVYWRITAAGFTTETGNNSIVITKGHNSWNSSLVCPSLLAGDTPNPLAESKFGNENLVFTYYEFSSVDNTLVQLLSAPTSAGEYYVKSSVAETNNYYGLTSNYVVFVIKSNITFISPVINYSELTVQGGQIDIYSNKYATVLYDFYYYVNAGELALYADHLPSGTKITFIDYSLDFPVFYYYILATDMDEIILTNFKKMGTITFFSYPISNDYLHSKFQFCIFLPHNNNIGTTINSSPKTLVLEQNGATKGSVVLNLFGAFSTTETIASPTLYIEDNCLKVDATVSASDENNELNKVLVYTLLDNTGNDVVLEDNGNNPTIQTDTFAELYFDDDTENTITQYFIANNLFFNLGTANITNKVAHLIIHNLNSGNYILEANVRVTELDANYCLNNATASNQKQSTAISYTHIEQIAIKATRVVEIDANQDKLIDTLPKTMIFDIESVGYDLSSLEIELLVKNDDIYTYVQNITYSPTPTNNYDEQISLTIPALSTGTYRLKFKLSDAYNSYYTEYTFLIK